MPGWLVVLVRFAYLAVANAFAVLRLLPLSDREKDVEILALRHQLGVLERQLGGGRVRFGAADRAFLAALLGSLPRGALRRLRLLVSPDTVLRWHRDLVRGRHAARSRPKRPGRPRRWLRSGVWCCAWSGRIPAGVIGGCTGNSRSSG